MKKKTTTKKKPAARPIPPPPPGWEIVGKDDPRLKNLPSEPLFYSVFAKEWLPSLRRTGEDINYQAVRSTTYALPIATQSATPQPQSPTPMIRLRLPSEKPTREDNVFAVCKTPNNKTLILSWPIILPFSGMVTHWFSLPDGILPREPSQEEKWRAEFEGLFAVNSERLPNGYYAEHDTAIMRQAFLAAKKGGAE